MATETAASSSDLAELISQINSVLYAHCPDTAKHYPPIHKLRLWRSRMKTKAADNFWIQENTKDQPKSVDELNQRIDELEREGHALRVKVKRLQEAGKTVIAQREQWKTWALATQHLMETERTRRSRRHQSVQRIAPLGGKGIASSILYRRRPGEIGAPDASRNSGRRSTVLQSGNNSLRSV